MRIIHSQQPLSTKPHSRLRYVAASFAVAVLVAGAYVALTLPPSEEPVGSIEGRIVEGHEAMAAAAARAPDEPAGQQGFRMCNDTSSTIGVALGYPTRQGWLTEGWWNLPSGTCEMLIAGALSSRFYYVYAIDYDQGGEWKGRHYLCTQARIFTIRGQGNCADRGLETTGFFEVDTGFQHSWTVQLTEDTQSGENGT